MEEFHVELLRVYL